MSTKHYWKKKLVNENLEVEYSSEEDMIRNGLRAELRKAIRKEKIDGNRENNLD